MSHYDLPSPQAKRISLGMSAMRRNSVLGSLGISPMQLDPHHIRTPVHVRALVHAQTRSCRRCQRQADKPTYCYVRRYLHACLGLYCLGMRSLCVWRLLGPHSDCGASVNVHSGENVIATFISI